MSQHDASPAELETFTLGWLGQPGSAWEIIGTVSLPTKPTTLGEARGGLEMVGEETGTALWLRAWAECRGEERDIVLELPGGWFQLSGATIAFVVGDPDHYMIRFQRRSAIVGPDD